MTPHRRIFDFRFSIFDYRSFFRHRKSEIGNRKFLIGSALTGIAALALPAVASACPFCKEILADPAQLSQRLATAKAYAVSIGVMLLVPVGLVGTITTVVVRTVRQRPGR